jgi:hypothetical protein
MSEPEAAMITENEPERDEIEKSPLFTLAFIFIVLAFLTICTLGVKLLSRLMVPRQTPTQVVPLAELPTVIPTDIPTVVPVNNYPIYLPIISSGSVSVSEQIWKVTNINSLGYELDGQRYDLATFQRVDSQDTAEAYCINRGWDIPEIGAEYWLNAEGIFTPLDNSHPIQRFLRIQNNGTSLYE